MIKKALIGTGIAAALGTFAFGTSAVSYMRMGVHEAREAVRSEIPVEFEIKRAKQEVERIVPEIEHCMHVIAEQQYDLEQRSSEIARRDADLGRQKDAILALRSDLDTGRGQFVYAARRYSAGDVREDLARRFERFKLAEDGLKRDRQVVDARTKALRANEEKLDNMLAAKKDLTVQIENLEARLNAVRAAEAVSDLKIDDNQLARAKELIRDLDKKIGTREVLLNSEGRFTGEIPVEADRKEKATEDVEGAVDAYFGDRPAVKDADAPAA